MSPPVSADQEAPFEGPQGLLRRGAHGGAPKWWVAAIAGAALLLLTGWWLTTNSPLFTAKRVDVTGTSHLEPATVLRQAEVGAGTHLFWLGAGPIEERLERDPWIAAATVTRELPATLRIHIEERKAVAQVRTEEGWLLVASDGTSLGRVARKHDFPVLSVQGSEPSRNQLQALAGIVGTMGKDLRGRVATIGLKEEGNVVVHLISGIPVYFGDPVQMVAKSQALAAILRWTNAKKETLSVINVNAPLAPTAQLYQPVVIVPDPAPISDLRGTEADDKGAPAEEQAGVQEGTKPRKNDTPRHTKKQG
jgi:cell division protein FtsQ